MTAMELPAIDCLQTLVRLPTISYREPQRADQAVFAEFVATLADLFPRLHARLELCRVADHGLLFHWPGRAAERPIVLMAHFDVVPVGEESDWTHPPFAAEIVDGELWGRGTLDDKGSLVAICAAVEELLAQDFVPAQDIWLSFGADEEVSGPSAPAAVAELKRRGVQPWLVLDEGGAIAADAFPGVSRPLGVIGVTEKGTTSLLLSTEGPGGHASTPVADGPVARLARAIVRLDRTPFPASLPAPTQALLEHLAPHAPAPLRALLSRVGQAPGLVARALIASGPEAASMTRTSLAVTTLSASPALNVIAAKATAGVNIRIMVGDTVDGVLAHVRRAVRDPSVRIDLIEADEASPISPYDGEQFALLTATMGAMFPDAVPTPYIQTGATDSRFFSEISPFVYRFSPFRMSRTQRASIHAINERIGVADFAEGVAWYRQLIEGLS